MRKLELDLAGVGPLDPVEPALGPLQLLAGAGLEPLAEDDERGVAQEDQPAARAQQPRRLRDPAVRVGPDRGAVLGESEVERRVRKRDALARRPRSAGTRARTPAAARRAVASCAGRRVDADGPRPALGEPGREVRGAAAELDDVEAGNVADARRPRTPGSRRSPSRSRPAPTPAVRSRRCARRSPSSRSRRCGGTYSG